MPAHDLALLIDAAESAGRIAARYWRQTPKTWDKPGNGGPVTEADLAVDEMLRERLTAARPDYGWLSEETEDDAARLDADRVFIVDPIDGTRAFVAGERGFAHALAVAERGQVTAAVVFLPMADRMYAARRGGGATLNGAPIRASARQDPEGASIFATGQALSADHWPGGVPRLDRHFRAALQHRLCLVADGSFDAAFSPRPTWEWDVAAGALIAAEAGCAVTGGKGEPLVFNAPGARCPGVLAAPEALHGALMARLRG